MITDIKQIKERVELALNQIRPYLQKDNGDIALIEITDNFSAKVELLGACANCQINNETFFSIVRSIKQMVPELKEVIPVNCDIN